MGEKKETENKERDERNHNYYMLEWRSNDKSLAEISGLSLIIIIIGFNSATFIGFLINEVEDTDLTARSHQLSRNW